MDVVSSHLGLVSIIAITLHAGCGACGGPPAGGLPQGDGGLTTDGAEADGPTGHDAQADGSRVDGAEADGAGASDASTFDGPAPPLARVVISEVVLTPRNDWSDGAGTPFQGAPGSGAITTRDEFVELENRDDESVDLSGWTLEIRDARQSATALAGHPDLVLSPGSTLAAFSPGGLVVIGDPVGSVSTDAYLILRDQLGRVVDEVEIGGLTASRDAEGDGIGDGAPDSAMNGFARGSFDEAIARPAGRADTDDDIADFDAMAATPLAPNVVAPPPVESTPPTLVAHAQGSAVRVTAALWVQLSEPVDITAGDAPGSITVTANGQPVALGFHLYEDGDSTIVLNPIGVLPFASDVTVTVHGGASGLKDRAQNPLAADVTFTVHTEAAPTNPGAVLINEVCATPLVDWSDSEDGNGAPFDAVPGTDRPSAEDEWIELVSLAPGAVDLSKWQIVLYPGPTLLGEPRQATPLTGGIATVVVAGGAGSITAVQPGQRVVIGDPAGSLQPSVWVELRDATGALVDAVEIGGNSSVTDRGGDGIKNGAPGPDLDGTALDAASATVARVPDGVDSGDDVGDWVHGAATPGTAN
jgi:hypothetical protein